MCRITNSLPPRYSEAELNAFASYPHGLPQAGPAAPPATVKRDDGDYSSSTGNTEQLSCYNKEEEADTGAARLSRFGTSTSAARPAPPCGQAAARPQPGAFQTLPAMPGVFTPQQLMMIMGGMQPAMAAPAPSLPWGMALQPGMAVAAPQPTSSDEWATPLGGNAGPPKVGRKYKTPEEVADAVERVKEKRRQSAQRSRQRKSEYIGTLEAENAALKREVARLRAQLAGKAGGGGGAKAPGSAFEMAGLRSPRSGKKDADKYKYFSDDL